MEIISTSESDEHESSSCTGGGDDDEVALLSFVLAAVRLSSGSMIFSIENFRAPSERCWGVLVIDSGDDSLLADSMIGLDDVIGIPGGLHGCIPHEFYKNTRRK